MKKKNFSHVKRIILCVLLLLILLFIFKSLKLVKEEMTNEPVLTYFYMEECGHCKKFTPEWEKFTNQKLIKTEKVEAKQMTKKHESFNIEGFPTVIAHTDGKKIKEFTGARTAEGLKNFVKNL